MSSYYDSYRNESHRSDSMNQELTQSDARNHAFNQLVAKNTFDVQQQKMQFRYSDDIQKRGDFRAHLQKYVDSYISKDRQDGMTSMITKDQINRTIIDEHSENRAAGIRDTRMTIEKQDDAKLDVLLNEAIKIAAQAEVDKQFARKPGYFEQAAQRNAQRLAAQEKAASAQR